MRSGIAGLTRSTVLGALALTVVGSSAMFTVFHRHRANPAAGDACLLRLGHAMLVTYGLG
jgi:MFS transporter, DHA1 family, inner membrane transport protein